MKYASMRYDHTDASTLRYRDVTMHRLTVVPYRSLAVQPKILQMYVNYSGRETAVVSPVDSRVLARVP